MTVQVEPTPRFVAALGSLREARVAAEVRLAEIPGPSRIASFAAALEATIPSREDPGVILASGSFILLAEPDAHPVWESDMRLVTLAKAPLEAELRDDPILGEVMWTWLVEALEALGPLPRALGGTATRTVGESFGTIRSRPAEVGIEVRASWTPPTTDIGAHLTAWTDFLCRVGGIEPLPHGVTRLTARRAAALR